MRIRVLHEIRLGLPAPARAVHLHLRLTPCSFEAQYVSRWRVESDLPAPLRAREDAFGSLVHALNWHRPVEAVTVRAFGEVETTDKAGIVRGAVETLPPDMFLRVSPLAQANPALRAFAAEIGSGDALDRMHRLMAAIPARLAFDGSLGAEAPASEAFGLARGGAGDFAHVFVAVARALDMPARVVTGYRLAEDGEEGAQMGAWAEGFAPGLGWVAFDPVHDHCPDARYIRVAAGLDLRDAAPVRAWTSGGEAAASGRVVVEQAAAQRQN